MIYIIRDKATPTQIKLMLEMLQSYIKLAVDIDREILSGGGAMHADCEAVLLGWQSTGVHLGRRLGSDRTAGDI
jgi:hypothetical protein